MRGMPRRCAHRSLAPSGSEWRSARIRPTPTRRLRPAPPRDGAGRARARRSPSSSTALVEAGADIRYVKPHGALYHAVIDDREQADAVAAARSPDSPPGSAGRCRCWGCRARSRRPRRPAGLRFVREAFLDRGYLPDGSLVPRGRPGALLDDPAQVAARAVRLVREGVVEAIDGSLVDGRAASLCVHGDSPAAVAMAAAVRAALDAAGIEVRAPW